MLVMAESTSNKRKWIGVGEEPDIDNEVEHDEDKTVTKIWFPCFSSCSFFLSVYFLIVCVSRTPIAAVIPPPWKVAVLPPAVVLVQTTLHRPRRLQGNNGYIFSMYVCVTSGS